MGLLTDGVMGCRYVWWFYAGFLRLLYWFYDGFMRFACGFSQSCRPLPTQPSCESQAMLMLLIQRSVRKTYVIAVHSTPQEMHHEHGRFLN